MTEAPTTPDVFLTVPRSLDIVVAGVYSLDMETTRQEDSMKARPHHLIADEIHQNITRRNYEARVAAARAADISVENRNLSQAWSFRQLHAVK